MPGRGAKHLLVGWLVVFWICFGLGYPNLARAPLGHPDSVHYYGMVERSPQTVDGHWRYRVLVPYLAKPFYHLARGRVGAWNPVNFGLLVVNAAFVASTVVLLLCIGATVLGNLLTPLLACLLYLVTFDVTNEQLGGMVDSSEAFLLAALTYALLANRWFVLPLIGVVGGFAKETVIPLAAMFAGSWWLAQWYRGHRTLGPLGWIALMTVAGVAAVCAVRSWVLGVTVLPWDIVASVPAPATFWDGLLGIVTSHYLLFTYLWLVPLSLRHLRRLPEPWIFAALGASTMALILGAYSDAGGNVARPIFDACGPLLCLSAAMWLVSWTGAANPDGTARTAG